MAKSDIAGVVITTQRGTTVSLDRHGQPLRPSMIWLDQRRASQVPAISWWWKAALGSLGMLETVRVFQAEAEANWMAQHQPALWAQTDKFLIWRHAQSSPPAPRHTGMPGLFHF